MNFKSTTEIKKKNTLLCKRQGKLFLFLLILGSTANNKPYIVFCPSAQLFWVKMGGTPKKNKQRKLELRGYNRSESHLFPFRERDSEKKSRAFRHLRKNYGDAYVQLGGDRTLKARLCSTRTGLGARSSVTNENVNYRSCHNY